MKPSRHEEKTRVIRVQYRSFTGILKQAEFAGKFLVAMVVFAVAGNLFVDWQNQSQSRSESHSGVERRWQHARIRADSAVKLMTRAQKEDTVFGTGWRGGPCTGHILPQPHVGLKTGLCLQDSPMGIRFADNVSAFPSGLNVATSFDKHLMRTYGEKLGAEFRAVGAHIALGPMTNLMRAHAAGRNWEGPGGDPYLAAVSASHIATGIQSQGVISTVKHFIANEQEHFRSDSSSNLDKRTLMEVYMAPFEACVRAGVAAVMCSYNRLNQVYTCANDDLVNNILKGPDIDFQGFVLTDWDAH
ncbi:hypothetical protein HK100_012867 [Physocladia obscura]|uniref:beta-glucosidase n=1 Tax=Physocladia obscura TaxID=109957 RepID=A0AAD5SZ35_9FUNG|nr:hypothetical protein HK100_012867 [Physocladia obscura]